MNIRDPFKSLLIILSSYHRLLKSFLYFLIYTAIIIGISLVITLPLWYAATKHSRGYTIIFILLLVMLTGLSLLKHLRQWIKTKQKSGISLSEIILIPLKKIAVFTFFILYLYGIVFIFSRGFLLIAVPLTASYILILGYFIFIYRKKNESI
ncbi:MAG: hypothetical protein KAR21_17985 [Spirochaetales bacterium]|nr:hypothetical protein [Spirochaetales bacterium]